jgi:hypothetical protein
MNRIQNDSVGSQGLEPAIGGKIGPSQGVIRRSRTRMLDDKDVIRLLRSEVDRAGGQSSWARQERIDRTLLNRVLSGRRPPSEQIIRALRLCNVYASDAVRVGGFRTIQVCAKD